MVTQNTLVEEQGHKDIYNVTQYLYFKILSIKDIWKILLIPNFWMVVSYSNSTKIFQGTKPDFKNQHLQNNENNI